MNKIYTQHKRLIGDTITPISCFLNLRDVFSGVSLFESSDYSSKDKSKSFICAEPILSFSASEDRFQIRKGNNFVEDKTGNLVELLTEQINSYTFENEELAALNGFFGAVSYDAIPQMETVRFSQKTRFTDIPEVYFAAYRYVVVFDNFTNKIDVLVNSFSEDINGLEAFEQTVFKSQIYPSEFRLKGVTKSNETDQSFSDKIKIGQEKIREGEVFQLVLSRAFEQEILGDDFEVYRQLRALNPSPYMFYFDLEKARLLGASPEAQFRVKDSIAEIHPIAGTVKRSGNSEEDKKRAKLLSEDKKENAEHTMLVDLARNDLNIACDDVEVKAYKEIQTFSHVIHMVSKVTGKLREKSVIKPFADTFPAGTLSGAPKYRAMQLIDELESDNRGFYGGAIGQITPHGDLNMAIIIRSALSYQNKLFYQAGAGVVMDSVPQSEVNEVYNKIGAVQKAIELANAVKNN